MKNNTKKYSYDIRELDSWIDCENSWYINDSYYIGTMLTAAKNEKRAFVNYLNNKGIRFKKNRTLVIYDCDSCYYVIDRKTKEPLYIAIPNY